MVKWRNMNWLDIVVLVVLAIAAVVGLKAGIIKTVLSVVGVVVGIILAGRYYVALAGVLAFIPQPNLAEIVAFAIILIAVTLVATVIAWLLKWAVSAVMLGWVNRLGGAIFGLVMGAIFCGALLTLWVKFAGSSGPVRDSALAKMLVDSFPIVLALLPGEFDSVRSFFR